MAKPKLNLNRLSNEDIVLLATSIKTQMTGNPNFTTPTPTLVSLGTLTTTAQTKINDSAAARATSKTKTQEEEDAVAALCAALTQLMGYVEAVSGGDAAKIESAGMSVRAAKTPSGVPAMVTNVAVTVGDVPGSLDVMWDPQDGAKGYELQAGTDADMESTFAHKGNATKSSATLSGLTSGSKQWVRVRAFGAAGDGPWSDPVGRIVP
jgi:hypothetical protein